MITNKNVNYLDKAVLVELHIDACDEWECAWWLSVTESRSRLRAGTGSDANSPRSSSFEPDVGLRRSGAGR